MNAPPRRALLRALLPLPVYLVLALIGALRHSAVISALAFPAALALWLAPALARGARTAWLVLACVAAGTALLARARLGNVPNLLLPVLIDCGVCAAFGASLRRGARPLIARFIAVVDGAETLADPEVATYARRLTLLWATWMALLGAIALTLALLATPGGLLALAGITPRPALPFVVWGWYANAINYLAVALLFALEYTLRPRLLPQVPRRGWFDFVARIVAAWREVLNAETMGGGAR